MPNPRHKPKLKREAKPERKVWLIPHTKPMPHISLRFATLRYASLRFATLRYASLRFATLRYASLHWASLSFTELSIISSQPEPLPLLSLRSTLHLYYLYYLYYLSNPSTFNQYLRNIQWIRLTRVRAEHLSEYHISTNRIVRSFVRSFVRSLITEFYLIVLSIYEGKTNQRILWRLKGDIKENGLREAHMVVDRFIERISIGEGKGRRTRSEWWLNPLLNYPSHSTC